MVDGDQVFILSGELSGTSAIQTGKVFTFNTVTPEIDPIEMDHEMVAGDTN